MNCRSLVADAKIHRNTVAVMQHLDRAATVGDP